MSRVQTGCNNCKRCTNSNVAEFGRKQTKFWLNLMTCFIPILIQAFTPNCRACSHKLSLHDRGRQAQGNSYATPVQQVPVKSTPPGWYPDPSGQSQLRWWDGTQWAANSQ